MTNTRLGWVDIGVNKEWRITSLNAPEGTMVKAIFQVSWPEELGVTQVDAAGNPISPPLEGTLEYDPANPVSESLLSFLNLRKFDDQGAFIPYNVREVSLEIGGVVYPFEDGRIEYPVGSGEFITTSLIDERYVYNRDLPNFDNTDPGFIVRSHDAMRFTFANWG